MVYFLNYLLIKKIFFTKAKKTLRKQRNLRKLKMMQKKIQVTNDVASGIITLPFETIYSSIYMYTHVLLIYGEL